MEWILNHHELIFAAQCMATALTLSIVIKRELS